MSEAVFVLAGWFCFVQGDCQVPSSEFHCEKTVTNELIDGSELPEQLVGGSYVYILFIPK